MPIKIALRLVDHTCHTTSKVYPAYLKIKEAFDNWRPWSGASPMRTAALDKIEQRWEWMEFNVHYATYACDPEFQHSEFNARTEEGLKALIKQWAPGTSSERAAYQQWVDYVGTVFSADALSDARALHPKQFWMRHGRRWPDLQPIMIKAFSCGTVASPCERNWSAWKYICSQQRYRLGISTAEKLVYVYANTRELAIQAGALPGRTRATHIEWGYLGN